MQELERFFADTLANIKEENLYRTTGDKVYSDEHLIFSSNDYLGLASKKISANNDEHVGSGASRLTTGTHEIHHELESYIAKWKKAEAAVLFGSGYLANFGVLSALLSPKDVAYTDSLNHASLIDGVRLSKVNKYLYHHNDMEHLESLMKSTRKKKQKALIITDSVFGMDGDKAKIKEISELAKKYQASVYIDEAHGAGVLGATGAGLVEEAGLGPKDVEIQMGTLSKAIGCEGAYVVGSTNLIRFIKNKCRSFIYTTAPSPLIAKEILNNLKAIAEDNQLRDKLKANIVYMREKLGELSNVKWQNDFTAIFPVFVGDIGQTLRCSEKLKEQGIMVPAIRPPSVPTARLRITMSAEHSFDDIDKLISVLKSF